MPLQDLLEVVPVDSDEQALVRALDFTRLPRHVAIIMDGNGRWAKKRFMPRVEGHRAGIESVRDVVESSARLSLEVLTLYAFSRENWKRPQAEVSTLMGLLKLYVRREFRTLMSNNIRFRVVGRPEGLPPDVQEELQRGVEGTRSNTGLIFNIALNYGGRTEIADAVQAIAREVQAGRLAPEAIDEDTVSRHLYTSDQPDPDLLIRTSGELRISNFLLWQIAYAEIWVTDVLWPDFRRRHLLEAIADFQRRDRRYGGLTKSP